MKFEQITDPEEINFTHAQNGENWRGPLTLGAYVAREALLGNTGIARKREQLEVQKKHPALAPWLGLHYFALKDGDTIISSCETLIRLGSCICPDSKAGIETNLVICLGSVFTPEKERGKGYATCLLQKLTEFYDRARDTPGAPAGVKKMVLTLYSEVGEYYKKFGYYSMHVPVHTISQVDAFYESYCEGREGYKGKPVGEDDYEELVPLQNEEFESHMMALHKLRPHSYIFTVDSDADLYKWYNARDKFTLQNIDRVKPEKMSFGYVLSDQSHILWHHLWPENTLVILKVYVHQQSSSKEQEVLRELLAHAVMETKSTGLRRIEFWDEEIPIKKFARLFSVLSDLEHSSMVYAENHSLSAVRPPPKYNEGNVIWDNNGKYCWF